MVCKPFRFQQQFPGIRHQQRECLFSKREARLVVNFDCCNGSLDGLAGKISTERHRGTILIDRDGGTRQPVLKLVLRSRTVTSNPARYSSQAVTSGSSDHSDV